MVHRYTGAVLFPEFRSDRSGRTSLLFGRGLESYFPLFDLSGKLFVYDFAGAGLDGFAGDTVLFPVKVEHLDIGIGGGCARLAVRQSRNERVRSIGFMVAASIG